MKVRARHAVRSQVEYPAVKLNVPTLDVEIVVLPATEWEAAEHRSDQPQASSRQLGEALTYGSGGHSRRVLSAKADAFVDTVPTYVGLRHEAVKKIIAVDPVAPVITGTG